MYMRVKIAAAMLNDRYLQFCCQRSPLNLTFAAISLQAENDSTLLRISLLLFW
ncbi:hypothetical protein ES319_D11G388100v1 [Gossypium barbadense]|uniref:Uncharacterized protein n=2 Tax=Gossypium TaxID=3633 RepID=A0A5J5PNP8_GOSBA|nr:hypothetical protein ES319_D11G388100v1 [Gossypium barbadense]TYG48240.1 hypothetical protein ES288_D11G408100v1 [Gossypium darwinii]